MVSVLQVLIVLASILLVIAGQDSTPTLPLVSLTIKNYEEEIPKLAKCSGDRLMWEGTVEEAKTIEAALKEAGIVGDNCPKTDTENQDSRRRLGGGRPRNGPRRFNTQRRVQFRRQ